MRNRANLNQKLKSGNKINVRILKRVETGASHKANVIQNINYKNMIIAWSNNKADFLKKLVF